MRAAPSTILGLLWLVFLAAALLSSGTADAAFSGDSVAADKQETLRKALNGNVFLDSAKTEKKAKPAAATGKKKSKQSDPEDEEDEPDGDAAAVRSPYKQAVLTQGPHGMSYGHYAIDLTGGKGAALYAPITGQVTQLYVDEYNNTTLVIENEIYQVLMLHGNYSVSEGQYVHLGDEVGYEWNNGYTVDWNGNLCAGRDCGYHTHLNIYDKRSGQNVDPRNLIEISW